MAQRRCYVCGLQADYDDLPDGSVCYIGIMACGECAENGRAAAFVELVDAENVEAEKVELMLEAV